MKSKNIYPAPGEFVEIVKQSAIEVRAVTKIFGSEETGLRALDDVSVTIRQNEFFTLLGPSGCGKTTLLRLIAGFEFPTSGEILLHGENIAEMPPFKRPINTVFQSYALFPHLTVAQNIGFGLEMLGKPRSTIDARVKEMLALVRMDELANRRTDQISGGQAQRVALARALAPQPKVLLLDEPLSALDFKLRKEMQIELKRMQTQTGITFIFVTHDQEEALTMSDRIAVMSKGRILQIGSPHEIYDHPSERFVADFIGESNLLEGKIASIARGKARIRLNAGVEIDASIAKGTAPTGKVTVMVRPEHADLAPAKAGKGLVGKLETTVYSGNDTHYHVRLKSGGLFVVRNQSRRSTASQLADGQLVQIAIQPDAVHLLRD